MGVAHAQVPHGNGKALPAVKAGVPDAEGQGGGGQHAPSSSRSAIHMQTFW